MTTSIHLKKIERKKIRHSSTECKYRQQNFLNLVVGVVASLVVIGLSLKSDVGKLKEKVTQLEVKNRLAGGSRKTCLDALTADPSLESGMFWIDPDGQGMGDDPIYVHCNMTLGSTSVLHDSEDSIDIDHCLEPGCYSREIKYSATLRQMTMLIELSNVCQQSIKIDCFNAAFEFNGISYAFWNDRKGVPYYFWSGSNSNTISGDSRYHTCQCGLDGACKDKTLNCNCDSDLAIESSDDGKLTDKELLPVTKLNFGRTIAPTSTNRHTLGRLECSGKVVLNGMPSSCQDLWRIGYTLSGLYSIKGSNSNKVETVYCDFRKLPGDQGFQTQIGYTDVKSENVYFTVERNTRYKMTREKKTLPFEKETNNEGNAFNLESGIFTASRNGAYFFMFSASAEGYTILSLQSNDKTVASCTNDAHCNIPYTVKLKSGDRVCVFVSESSPHYSGHLNNAMFTGFLISEDIFTS